MTTPSSSATSPSPPMAYLPNLTASVSPTSVLHDSFDKDNKKKTVQKFLQRAEMSSITRGLRTRLSVASYKATHGVAPASYRDLEGYADAQTQATSFYRPVPPRRKAATAGNYYSGGMGALPLSSNLTARVQQPPGPNGGVVSATHDTNAPSRTNTNGQSLFESILAPPPQLAKHARTILNATDSFASVQTHASGSSHSKVAKSIAESTRAHTNAKASKSSPGMPEKRKAKRSGHKRKHGGVDADGDVEMKAAATLTSFLFNHRSTPGAGSPRSSVDTGSDAGSGHGFVGPEGQPPTITLGHSDHAMNESGRITTPPPPPPNSEPTDGRLTPRPAPTDNEAADLMLFLATSPSPVRRSRDRDTADLHAYHTLGGSSLRAKPRILFPTGDTDTEPASGSMTPRMGSSLAATGDPFASMSSITSEANSAARDEDPSIPTSASGSSSELLPPQVPSSLSHPTYRKIQDASPRPSGGLDFNINDFINSSPSPTRPPQKASLGLRADVGRRLFEEEQAKVGMNVAGSSTRASDQQALGASIDLLKT